VHWQAQCRGGYNIGIANRAYSQCQEYPPWLQALSEYHTDTGRLRERDVLEGVHLERNSEISYVIKPRCLSHVNYRGFKVGEISCPAKYFSRSSSINVLSQHRYGFGVLKTRISFRLDSLGWDAAQYSKGCFNSIDCRAIYADKHGML